MSGFQSFYSMLRDQFLSSFGPIDAIGAMALYSLEATLDEAAEIIAIEAEDPLADLTDRQRDLMECLIAARSGKPHVCPKCCASLILAGLAIGRDELCQGCRFEAVFA